MPIEGSAVRITPASGKIADITHADTAEHSMALPAGFPGNTRAILVLGNRIAGTGNFVLRSVSGVGIAGRLAHYSAHLWWVRAIDGLFYYNLTVANDDWDIYGVGYITGGS